MEQLNDVHTSQWNQDSSSIATVNIMGKQVEWVMNSGNFSIESSGIVVDMTAEQETCRGYCQDTTQQTEDFVCKKWENCKNFSRADSAAKKRNNILHTETLENLY